MNKNHKLDFMTCQILLDCGYNFLYCVEPDQAEKTKTWFLDLFFDTITRQLVQDGEVSSTL